MITSILKNCKGGFLAVWTARTVYDLFPGAQIGDMRQGQEVRVLLAACRLFCAAG